MRILVAAFAYNERPYIPYMVDHYRKQGCDLLILDNYSSDGTYEWLLENNVKTDRVDTNETFHLMKLQKALMGAIHKDRPDWVVYCGIDCYYYLPDGIQAEIEKADKLGCTTVDVNHFSMYNTGEPFKLPFYENYFFGNNHRRLRMIGKYCSGFEIIADSVVSRGRTFMSRGLFINYGMCKPSSEREETYRRRVEAWGEGERRNHGVHYKPAAERNWIWSKETLTDIRETELYSLMQ